MASRAVSSVIGIALFQVSFAALFEAAASPVKDKG